MTTARQIVHVLRKDVVQLRWWIAGYALLVCAAALFTARPLIADRSMWMETLVPLVWLLGGIIAATSVQTDSPSRPDAFWASRPIGVGALLAAKLVLTLSLLGLPLLGESVVLASMQMPTTRLVTMTAMGALLYMGWLLLCMLVAASTRQLVGFVGTMIAVPAMLAVIAVATDEVELPAGFGGALQAFATIGALALLVTLYQRRARSVMWQLASGSLLAVGILAVMTPAARASLEPVRDAAPSALTLTLDSVSKVRVGEPDGAIVTVRGMQRDKRYEFRADSSRFEGHDGKRSSLAVVVGLFAPLGTPVSNQTELPLGESAGIRLYWFPRPDSTLRYVRIHGTVEASRATVLAQIRADGDTSLVDQGVHLRVHSASSLTGTIRVEVAGAFADRSDIPELLRLRRAYGLRTRSGASIPVSSTLNYQVMSVSQRLLPLPGTSLHVISRIFDPRAAEAKTADAQAGAPTSPTVYELVRWDVVERIPVSVERTMESPSRP